MRVPPYLVRSVAPRPSERRASLEICARAAVWGNAAEGLDEQHHNFEPLVAQSREVVAFVRGHIALAGCVVKGPLVGQAALLEAVGELVYSSSVADQWLKGSPG